MTASDSPAPIFVVDDSATDVFFLQRRLREARIPNPLRHFEDGRAAVQWFEQRTDGGAADRPWLIFVDLKMPQMDGFQVLEWLQAHGWADQLTIAVLSMSDDPVDMQRAAQLGAHKYLVKYPTPADLAALDELAARRAQAAPGHTMSAGVLPGPASGA